MRRRAAMPWAAISASAPRRSAGGCRSRLEPARQGRVGGRHHQLHGQRRGAVELDQQVEVAEHQRRGGGDRQLGAVEVAAGVQQAAGRGAVAGVAAVGIHGGAEHHRPGPRRRLRDRAGEGGGVAPPCPLAVEVEEGTAAEPRFAAAATPAAAEVGPVPGRPGAGSRSSSSPRRSSSRSRGSNASTDARSQAVSASISESTTGRSFRAFALSDIRLAYAIRTVLSTRCGGAGCGGR